MLEGLRGEETIAELCRRKGIAQSLYYKWSNTIHSRQWWLGLRIRENKVPLPPVG